MYKLEIKDSDDKIVKTYEFENVYISDVFVENNMITLNRVTKSGDTYTSIDRDYITNNEEKAESNISLQEYSTSLKELQYRLVYADGIDDKKPKILKPKQVLYENPTTVAFDSESEKGKFYVYGLGQMLGLYDKAGYAVQKADEVSGVVVSSDQAYVWERETAIFGMKWRWKDLRFRKVSRPLWHVFAKFWRWRARTSMWQRR